MGLARAAVNLLLHEAARQPFHGRIVTLGRQHVYVTADELRALADTHGVKLQPVPVELHRDSQLAAKQYLSDGCLFRMLGFDEVVRVDYSDYEAPDAILDLNAPSTPEALCGAFDVVLDSGTIEHVFDIAAALKHCCRMVKVGGRVIHLTPSSNCIEHGFHSVSPTLFADFYAASHFDIEKIYLCRIPLDLPRGYWSVFDYLNSPRFIPLGQLDDKIWFTFCVATATENSVPTPPMQWVYVSTWKKSVSDQADQSLNSISSEPADSKAGRLLLMLKRFPLLARGASTLIAAWRKLIQWYRTRFKRLPYPFIGRF